MIWLKKKEVNAGHTPSNVSYCICATVKLELLLEFSTSSPFLPRNGAKPSFSFANRHLNSCLPLLHVFDLPYKCKCSIASMFPSNFHPVIPHLYLSLNVAFCLATIHVTHHPKSVTAVTVDVLGPTLSPVKGTIASLHNLFRNFAHS